MYPLFNERPLPSGIGLTGFVVSNPQIQIRTVNPLGMRGMVRTGKKIGNRVITMHAALIYETHEHAVQIWRDFLDWCYSDEPGRLILPGDEDRYILAECDQFPIPDFSKPFDMFDFAFNAQDPAFYSTLQSSQGVSSGGIFRIGGGLDVPVTISGLISSDQDELEIMVDGYTIELAGSIDAGRLTVQTGTLASVSVGDEDVTDLLTLASDIDFTLGPGAHTITYPASLSGVTVTWRDAWL